DALELRFILFHEAPACYDAGGEDHDVGYGEMRQQRVDLLLHHGSVRDVQREDFNLLGITARAAAAFTCCGVEFVLRPGDQRHMRAGGCVETCQSQADAAGPARDND